MICYLPRRKFFPSAVSFIHSFNFIQRGEEEEEEERKREGMLLPDCIKGSISFPLVYE